LCIYTWIHYFCAVISEIDLFQSIFKIFYQLAPLPFVTEEAKLCRLGRLKVKPVVVCQ
jgi:hypothetical protein